MQQKNDITTFRVNIHSHRFKGIHRICNFDNVASRGKIGDDKGPISSKIDTKILLKNVSIYGATCLYTYPKPTKIK